MGNIMVGSPVNSSNGGQLTIGIEDPSRFDLVITDQTMPDVTGVTLAQKMLKVRKEMPIILCTGYSERPSRGGRRRTLRYVEVEQAEGQRS